MTYRLPTTVSERDDARAVAYLERYFGRPYTGAHFDEWPERAPDRFTADDLVAVSFLSVFVPPMAARELLLTAADRFADLLAAIGPDRDLVEEVDPVGPEWPAWRLYRAVRELGGVGPTIASKLLARKRPRLLPIYDSVVGQVTGSSEQWEPLRQLLRADGGTLHQHLVGLRHQAGVPAHVSPLRIYDVLTWMEGKDQAYRPQTREEQLGADLADPGTPED